MRIKAEGQATTPEIPVAYEAGFIGQPADVYRMAALGRVCKAAPNKYRGDRVSGDPSVIARSPCDEAIQGPQHARSQQARRSYRGPWIASRHASSRSQ